VVASSRTACCVCLNFCPFYLCMFVCHQCYLNKALIDLYSTLLWSEDLEVIRFEDHALHALCIISRPLSLHIIILHICCFLSVVSDLLSLQRS